MGAYCGHVLFADLAAASIEVRATRSRKKKIAALASCVRGLSNEELEPGVAMLSGRPRQGKIGLGYRAAFEVVASPATSATWSVLDIDATLQRIKEEGGAGSLQRRKDLLGRMLAAATEPEQSLIRGLVIGEVRQGALEGVMVEAIAAAAEVDAGLVRRAHMLGGQLATVARTAMRDGAAGLAAARLELFRPILPMLAQPAASVEEAFTSLDGELGFEWKIDGARIQVHKDGDRVEVYSRKLNSVTAALPEVVEMVRTVPARRLILDGEVIALRPDGRPHPFQTTMRRFGRKLDVETMRIELPLSPFFFDLLQLDDDAMIDCGTNERWSAMQAVIPAAHRVPRLRTEAPDRAAAFIEDALDRGHEGVMAKAGDLPYEAGRRGSGWLKLKPTHTLDLVVLAAEWGSGRRKGWLSNLHLGARDPSNHTYIMLGKTFKGLTDEMLIWQTEAFRRHSVGEEGHVVHLEPHFVVEIAFNDVQHSPHYPAGMALRFARVKAHRTDKTPEQADTIDSVRAIYDASR